MRLFKHIVARCIAEKDGSGDVFVLVEGFTCGNHLRKGNEDESLDEWYIDDERWEGVFKRHSTTIPSLVWFDLQKCCSGAVVDHGRTNQFEWQLFGRLRN